MKDKDSKTNNKEIKIDNDCIFSKENVNMGHQPEFDYLKTLGVFEITVVHIYIFYNFGFLLKFVKHISLILTAGALMSLMGTGVKYSRHHEIKYYIARGFVLLTLAQYFNLVRDCLPNLIAWWATGKPKFISRALLVIRGDILTFAGLSQFLLALFIKMKLSDITILIIGTIMNFISYPLFNIMKSPSNYLLSQFLGYFVLTKAESYFPICGYFVFVAFGHWMGGFYQKMVNKDKYCNRILIIFVPILAVYHYCRCHYDFPMLPSFNSEEHFMLSPGPDAIARCVAILVFLAGFYKIDKMLGKTPEFISHCGKNLTQYYMISFIVTMHMNVFMKATRGEKYTADFKYIDIFAFALLYFSRVLIKMNDKYIHFTITTLKNPKRKIVFSLIWILAIISVIYIYPKVDVYANQWNNYLDEYANDA
mgnify:CR=1 FL=1